MRKWIRKVNGLIKVEYYTWRKGEKGLKDGEGIGPYTINNIIDMVL